MTIKSNPIQDTSLIIYTPQEDLLTKARACLQKMQELLMKKSFNAQIADYQHFHKSKGEIIVLTGIVAAGKSSITNAIKSVDPLFYEEDLDLRRDPKTPTTLEMENSMIDDTINRSVKGGKTIISLMDAGKIKNRITEKGIFDLPMKTVLLHCPFSEITSRLEARNNAAEAPGGDQKNYRNPLVPLNQFATLYLHHSGEGIETINRAQAIGFFNSSFDKMVARAKKQSDPLPPDEQIAQDKVECLEAFLAQLGFDGSETHINVIPRNAYDLVIDTSTCRDTASRIQAVAQLLKK